MEVEPRCNQVDHICDRQGQSSREASLERANIENAFHAGARDGWIRLEGKSTQNLPNVWVDDDESKASRRCPL